MFTEQYFFVVLDNFQKNSSVSIIQETYTILIK